MRLLRSPAFVFSALLIAFVCLWYFWGGDWLAERRWQAYAQEARARGLPWTLAELRPAPVPAAEDAALLPVFARNSPALPQGLSLAKGRKRSTGAHRPIDWQKTRSGLAGAGLQNDLSISDDLLAIDKAIQSFQPIVDQLCNSPAVAGNWGDESWVAREDFGISWLGPAMRCIRALSMRANIDIALARPAPARAVIEAQLRFGRALHTMPTLLPCLVAFNNDSLACDAVRRGLDAGIWDEPALHAFAAAFLAKNAIADYLWSMQTERAYSRELAERWIGNPDKVVAYVSFTSSGTSKVNEWLLRMRASRRFWWRDNQLWIEQAQDELASSLDGDNQLWRLIDPRYAAQKLSTSEREGKLALAAAVMSGMPSFAEKAVWNNAQDKMGAIACGLELSRRANGRYPPALDSLVPDYLPRLPLDPVTARSFRYSLRPDGTYLLYSLASDREDQGGKVQGDPEDGGGPDWPW